MPECTSRRILRQGIQHDKIVETANMTRACRTDVMVPPVSAHTLRFRPGAHPPRRLSAAHQAAFSAGQSWRQMQQGLRVGETIHTRPLLAGVRGSSPRCRHPQRLEQILDQDRSSLNNSLATIQDDQHPLAVQEFNQSASGSSSAISSPSAEASFRATNNVPREVHSRPRRLPTPTSRSREPGQKRRKAKSAARSFSRRPRRLRLRPRSSSSTISHRGKST